MIRMATLFFLLAALCSGARGEDPSPSVVVKKLAQQVGDWTPKGDCAKVIDQTYDRLVKEMGGRERAIKATETVRDQLKARGFTFKAFKIGEPGEILTEGDNTFVIVPTTVEMTFSEGRIVGKSYLLGISPDKGNTWKFLDGSGLDNKDLLARVLPKLPAKLKLPEKQKPEIIRDK